MQENAQLNNILEDCRNGNRSGQKQLYELFYSYGMSVCLHNSKNREEAVEILNDGFYKVFKNLDQYRKGTPFKPWFRAILVNASIDYFRKFKKYTDVAADTFTEEPQENYSGLDNLAYEELIILINRLSPAYRMVFNLYVIEGFSHPEIAKKLEISTGTSKSNLAKARRNLQAFIAAKQTDKQS